MPSSIQNCCYEEQRIRPKTRPSRFFNEYQGFLIQFVKNPNFISNSQARFESLSNISSDELSFEQYELNSVCLLQQTN